MIAANELRKGSVLLDAKQKEYVIVNTIGTESCLVKPFGDSDDLREYDILFEELNGIEIDSCFLVGCGFKVINEEEDYQHPDGLHVRLTEYTFWIMDRTDSAVSKRLTYIHHLQNIYSALYLKELDVKRQEPEPEGEEWEEDESNYIDLPDEVN